jgi:hypothetical protein
MANINVRTSKPAHKKSPFALTAVRAPTCRRCGDTTCSCSEEELDQGGPAPL